MAGSAPPRSGAWRRPGAWSVRTVGTLALAAAGALAAGHGLLRLWPIPPLEVVALLVGALAFVLAAAFWVLAATGMAARASRSIVLRLLVFLPLASAGALASWRVAGSDFVRWVFQQGSREAVTTIRPSAGGGPVFDVYRVTDGRPQLAVRRFVWSELVLEAEDEGDFAENVDRVVHGHRLVFDPGGSSHERWATIDGLPARIENR